jgi:uncharacterized protein (DUF2249 family)
LRHVKTTIATRCPNAGFEKEESLVSFATTQTPTIDVRAIAPQERHQRIFATFEGLPPGAAFELLNDHDPLALQHQFDQRHPGRFNWTYIERGPDSWRVRICKSEGGCCGGGCR